MSSCSTKDSIIRSPMGGTAPLPDPARQDGTIRVATLSWSLPERDDLNLTRDEFFESLASIGCQPDAADLILCSGCQLPGEVRPLEMLKELPQWNPRTSVLYEVVENRRVLFHAGPGAEQARLSCLRSQQCVRHNNSDSSDYQQLFEVLASGAGLIRFEGIPVPLVLLTCGENNAIAWSGRSSILKPQMRRPLQHHQPTGNPLAQIEAFCQDQWILLNPAHRWYRNKSFRAGFGKAHPFIHPTGPRNSILERLCAARHADGRSGARFQCKDGTTPPWAVIHCNNFQQSNDPLSDENRHWHEDEVASVCFSGTQPHHQLLATIRNQRLRSGRSWHYECFEIRFK